MTRRNRIVYEVKVEVSAAMACFPNPLSGYLADTFDFPNSGAVEGLVSAIAVVRGALVRAKECRLCYRPEKTPEHLRIGYRPQRSTYRETYNGVLRKSDLKVDGDPQLLFSTVLVNPVYQITVQIENWQDMPDSYVTPQMAAFKDRAIANGKKFNSAHALQEMLVRRISRGQCYRTPYLGRREFSLDYIGPWREDSKKSDVSYTIPSFPVRVFQTPASPPQFTFAQNVKISEGVLAYSH